MEEFGRGESGKRRVSSTQESITGGGGGVSEGERIDIRGRDGRVWEGRKW